MFQPQELTYWRITGTSRSSAWQHWYGKQTEVALLDEFLGPSQPISCSLTPDSWCSRAVRSHSHNSTVPIRKDASESEWGYCNSEFTRKVRHTPVTNSTVHAPQLTLTLWKSCCFRKQLVNFHPRQDSLSLQTDTVLEAENQLSVMAHIIIPPLGEAEAGRF